MKKKIKEFIIKCKVKHADLKGTTAIINEPISATSIVWARRKLLKYLTYNRLILKKIMEEKVNES